MYVLHTYITYTVRYLIDFGDSNAKRLAYRYYKAAFYFDPLMGKYHIY